MDGCDALIRQKALQSILDKMDDKERIAFAMMAMQERNHRETMDALAGLGKRVDASKHSWLADFGANIAGNAVFDGAVWVLSRLIRKI